jgi:hypothetical protein
LGVVRLAPFIDEAGGGELGGDLAQRSVFAGERAMRGARRLVINTASGWISA